MLQLLHKSDRLAACITNRTLRHNLLQLRLFQFLFGSSDSNDDMPAWSLSGYRTEDASTYKKWNGQSECYWYTLFSSLLRLHKLKYRSQKDKKDDWGN